MSALAIITARGGSKRIPRKNIRPFLGKPILLYSIEAALQAGIFDEVMVSTDDPEIAELAKGAGASVPFLRSAQTANDYASTDDVIREVLECYRAAGRSLTRSAVSTPPRRLLPPKTHTAMELLKDAESVMPVTTFPYPVLRSLAVDRKRSHRLQMAPVCDRAQPGSRKRFTTTADSSMPAGRKLFFREGTTDTPGMVPLFTRTGGSGYRYRRGLGDCRSQISENDGERITI